MSSCKYPQTPTNFPLSVGLFSLHRSVKYFKIKKEPVRKSLCCLVPSSLEPGILSLAPFCHIFLCMEHIYIQQIQHFLTENVVHSKTQRNLKEIPKIMSYTSLLPLILYYILFSSDELHISIHPSMNLTFDAFQNKLLILHPCHKSLNRHNVNYWDN